MRVSCIIPAHDESATVANVVQAASDCRQITEFIVVSDGSTDETPQVASAAGADRVLVLRRNMGKGAALMAGAQVSRGDVILLVDADLCGVTPKNLAQLLSPVLAGPPRLRIHSLARGPRAHRRGVHGRAHPHARLLRPVQRPAVRGGPEKDAQGRERGRRSRQKARGDSRGPLAQAYN